MKITIETEDMVEGQLLLQAYDYHFSILAVARMFRTYTKYSSDNISEEVLNDREKLKDDFYKILEEHNINLELLP